MEKTVSLNKIKRQVVAAVLMVCVSIFAMGTSTYAWLIASNRVTGSGAAIAVQSTENVLFIAAGATPGGELTGVTSPLNTVLLPASTENMTRWWVMDDCDENLKVVSYQNPSITEPVGGTGAGAYTDASGNTCNAYCVATYNIFTAYGIADIYLNGAVASPISLTGGTGSFPNAVRIGIVVDDVLKFVYVPNAEESNLGNDLDASAGYRTVQGATSTKAASYMVLSGNDFSGYTAHKTIQAADIFAPDDGATPLATGVDRDGVVVKLYIWLEGTDSDCVSNNFTQANDNWDVTVSFAGVTVG